MTVDEPRRADSSWHMRPSDASAAAAAGNDGQSVNPLVVSFPAGFHPPVSGWEAYEGAGGQQLLVVARAVRTEEKNGKRRREKEQLQSIDLVLLFFFY